SAIHALSPPIVHGGLCPRNVVATARGGIKLLDVGLRQAAQGAGETRSSRALAYAAPESSAEPTAKGDMRALGVMLFELVTGELPPPGAASVAARRILDALWPSMADFVAGLLAEDPALRPGAAEAAKILGDHWAEIPDASMVAEMTALVRNFSAFVADTTMQNTLPPVATEPAWNDVDASGRQAVPPVIAVAPPALLPAVAPREQVPSGSFFASGDETTLAAPIEGYASAIFRSLPTDASVPEFAEELEVVASLSDATGPLSADVGLLVPQPAVPESEPESEDELPPLPTLEALSSGEGQHDSEPIPELAEWGAQALAALGDQAGVEISPLASMPEAASAQAVSLPPAPLVVSDPTIEEAFALVPPPPSEPDPVKTGPSVAEILRAKGTLSWPAMPLSLEADLVDDLQTTPGVIMASAFEAPAEDGEVLSVRLPDASAVQAEAEAQGAPDLEATAFAVAEVSSGGVEGAPPRLAHAMPAPESEQVRRPAPRTAMKSEADIVARVEDNMDFGVAPSRARRVVTAMAIIAGIGGIVAGAVGTLGSSGKKRVTTVVPDEKASQAKVLSPALPAQEPVAAMTPQSPPVTAKSNAKPVLVAPPTAKANANAVPVAPSMTKANADPVPSAPPAKEVPAVAASKPASASAAINLPIATQPDGAMVWIDGEERGKTPCVVKLRPGSARLVLVHAGYLASQSSIDVREGAKVDVTLQSVEPPMQGEARFRADCKTQGKFPVLVDGKETGILCPYSKMHVEPGSHTIGVLVPSTGTIHEKEITLFAGVRSISFGD
ncbi:MAG TPA: PEGA domain-containing protein, partial [Polyangia bacterium]